MRLVVVGAGQVGSTVAKGLDTNHDIIVVDHDPEKLDSLRYEADVMTFEGNGAEIEVLEEVNTSEADMVIASTDDDRTNILVCGTARALNPDLFAIARVANTGYLKSWMYSKKAFNVDLMVGSDYLTARSIVQVGFQQMARSVEYFGRGRIEMAEFNVPADCSFAGQTVRDADLYKGLRYAAVFDGDEMEVVGGDTVIPPGGRLLVIGRSQDVRDFGKEITDTKTKEVNRVFILGGGEIAYQTAQLMEQRGISPKVVESDRERAEFLAKNLPDSYVLHDDATDPKFLEEEGLPRAQLVVSALRPDERNLFTALQSIHLGADRTISVVHENKYIPLFERFDVDVTVNPRQEVIEEILSYTRERQLERVAFVGMHHGEVIEVELDADSPLVGGPLKETIHAFPDALVIGAVSRGGDILIPEGDTVLQPHDNLVIFADSDIVEEVVETI
jgi:trk system potassium uptake protein TrkA